MAVTEPTKLPRFSTTYIVDGTSGEGNRVEPSESKKDSGFLFQERPPRQDHNWLFYIIYLWVEWFQQQVNAMYNNLNNVFASQKLDNDMLIDNTSLTLALQTIYTNDNIEGIDILDVDNQFGYADITFGDGSCFDSLYVWRFNFGLQALTFPLSGYIKRFTSGTYVRGSGGDGLATGASLSDGNWYYAFLVQFDDTDKTDIVFDDNSNGDNVMIMSNVQYYRRVRSFFYVSNASGLYKTRTTGNHHILYNEQGGNAVVLTPGNEIATFDVSNFIPPGNIIGLFDFAYEFNSTDADIFTYAASPGWDTGQATPNSGFYFGAKMSGTVLAGRSGSHEMHFPTTDRNLVFKCSALTSGNVTVRIFQKGYIDTRLPWFLI